MLSKTLSRRHFLQASFLAGAGVLIAACKPAATPTSQPAEAQPTSTPQPATQPTPTLPPTVTPAKEAGKLTVICTSDRRPSAETVINPAFTEKTGVSDIELIDTAWNDIHNKIVTMAVSGTPVDVTYVDTIWPGEFAQAGFLKPLDGYMTEEVTADLFEVTWQQSVYKGKPYAMPDCANLKWLFYNKEMLEAAGIAKPAETWEEFIAHSQSCIDQGLAKYGTSWGWMLAEGLVCDWTCFLHGFGGKWREGEDDQSGDWIFNGPEGAEALEFMHSTIAEGGVCDPGSLQLNDRTDLNTFMAGETPYNVNWSYAVWMTADPAESQVAGKVGLALWPAKPPTRSASVTGGGGNGIMSATRDADLAWQYLETASSSEVQIKLLCDYANPTVRKSVASDPQVLAEIPLYGEMAKQYEYAHFRPVLSWYTEWSEGVQVELQSALSGAKPVQQALDDAVAKSNAGSAKYES